MILHEGVLQEQLSHVVLIDLVTIQELIALEVVVALEVVLHDRHRTDRLHHLETAIALSIFQEEDSVVHLMEIHALADIDKPCHLL